jgi:hypothetical protein
MYMTIMNVLLKVGQRAEKIIFFIFFRREECVGHFFVYVSHFVVFERCLDSNLESSRSKQARYQLIATHLLNLTT